ncbi:hypothetical protein CDAR_488361 [Caerostris darwini]|uniref:Uncharacterized protein n=1 Tax=Caerostris darwini TaxID=1538125 RepID=A0AAV4Q095_9ARAC|nr:hypothetical protein CDAR_488361 [Caerostris darwini]
MKSVLNQDDVTIKVIVANQEDVTIKVIANQDDVTTKVIVANQDDGTSKVIVANQDDVTIKVIVANRDDVTTMVIVANRDDVTTKVLVANQNDVITKVIVANQGSIDCYCSLWFSALLPKETLVFQDPLCASALSVLFRAPQVVQRIIERQKFVNGFRLTGGAKLGLCRAMASSNISASSSPRPSAKTFVVAKQVWQSASLVLFFKRHSELDRSIRSFAIRMKGRKWTQSSQCPKKKTST